MGQQLASSIGAPNSTNSSSLSLGADFFDDATSTAPCNSTGSAPSSSNTTSSLSGAVLVQVNVSGIVAAELEASASVNITFSSADKSQVVKTGYLINNWIWLDRSGATAFDSPLFNDKFSAWYLVRPSMEFSLTVVVDRSIIEVFLDDGALLGSSVFFATQPLTSVDVAVGGIGSARAEAAVWGLTGTWNMNGTTQ
jgi:beta-fructofuranosidase